jgi:prepilin-type N-terminal cleavage/methylation domain-containing protein
MTRRKAFTLVELMIVITIIGILVAFIIRASMASVRRAEHAATVSLIAKLEAALTDRLDALTAYQADVNPTHTALGAIYNSGAAAPLTSSQRAQVIANYDRLRAELPDVFVVDTADADYPLNFAAERFNPNGGAPVGNYTDYQLPLGANPFPTPPALPVPVTGMKGASFSSAAAVYKQLGYSVMGTDGNDNDGDGMIDELDEGTKGLPADQVGEIARRLASHKHKTSRSEMLYAILVEGTGPLGSAFNREDFGLNDIKDTDGDGLMEFVDAFGEPLQFYRWPIMFRSDTQKGFPDMPKIVQDTAAGVPIGPYGSVYEGRQQDPLDPNQTLMAPAWWGAFNSSYPWSTGSNRGPATFGAMFHTLAEPLAISAAAPSNATYWDRSVVTGSGMFAGIYQRRAYYSRFLVVSGGPDKMPGTAQLGVDYKSIDERSAFPKADGTFDSVRDGTGTGAAVNVTNVIQIENQGGKIDPTHAPGVGPTMTGGRNDTNTQLEEYAQDDITTQNLHSSGGPLPSNQ